MDSIPYLERTTEQIEREQIYGGWILRLLYNKKKWIRFLTCPILEVISKWPFFSRLYGTFQRSPLSKYKVLPFIKKYRIDTTEFLDDPSSFRSFNAFFIRKLKPECRPFNPGRGQAIIPADGRYRFYPNLAQTDFFYAKGQRFSLSSLLQNEAQAKKYHNGSAVMGRLCPTDYHRFHFPCDNTPNQAQRINGYLYSVNPMALKQNLSILTENKRMVTILKSEAFGEVLFIEIGATNVGAIHQTYTPEKKYQKGDEKGFFSFGGSFLVLLFEPGRLILAPDLQRLCEQNLEIRCLMGQRLGSEKF